MTLGLVGAATKAGDTSERDEALDRASSLDERVKDLEATVSSVEAANGEFMSAAEAADIDLQTALDAQSVAEAAVADAEAAVADAEAAVADAETRAAAAEADRDAVLARFDPEIQAAVAQLQTEGEAAACDNARRTAAANETQPGAQQALREWIDTIPAAVLKGRAPEEVIDFSAVEAKISECFAAAQQEAATAAAAADAERQRQALVSPKSDGLYTIGLEMAPGRWRSTGTADDCYWKRSPDGIPDDIIDNHFGLAGGTVTVYDGEEFETSDCGTWEFVG